jgi:hypothetical protein
LSFGNCTNDLEDLLFEREELQKSKESIKVLEKHLAGMEGEIRGKTHESKNKVLDRILTHQK